MTKRWVFSCCLKTAICFLQHSSICSLVSLPGFSFFRGNVFGNRFRDNRGAAALLAKSLLRFLRFSSSWGVHSSSDKVDPRSESSSLVDIVSLPLRSTLSSSLALSPSRFSSEGERARGQEGERARAKVTAHLKKYSRWLASNLNVIGNKAGDVIGGNNTRRQSCSQRPWVGVPKPMVAPAAHCASAKPALARRNY